MRPQIAKEDLAVPTADTTDNAYAMDVVGNKTDAAAAGAVTATESVMAYAKQNVTNTEAAATAIATIDSEVGVIDGIVDDLKAVAEYTATTASINLAVGNNNIFTVTGVVQIVEIIGTVDTTFKVIANNTKIVAGGGSVDICGVVDITGAAQFSIFSITGTFANAMIINTGGAFVSQPGAITVGTGNIVVNCAGDDDSTGAVTWMVRYKPISSDGAIAAA